MLFPQHISDCTENRSSSNSRKYEVPRLFGASSLSVSGFRKLLAAGSSHDHYVESKPGRLLKCHACIIEFLASETDKKTRKGGMSPSALVSSA